MASGACAALLGIAWRLTCATSCVTSQVRPSKGRQPQHSKARFGSWAAVRHSAYMLPQYLSKQTPRGVTDGLLVPWR